MLKKCAIEALLFSCLLTAAASINILPLSLSTRCQRTSGSPWIIRKECREYYSEMANPPVRFCFNYSNAQSKCLECLDGFILYSNQCVLNESGTTIRNKPMLKKSTDSPNARVTAMGQQPAAILHRDPYCEEYEFDNFKCKKCYDGYHLDVDFQYSCKEDIYIAGPPSYLTKANSSSDRTMCYNLSSNGSCLACYPGSQLYNGTCLLKKQPSFDCRTKKDCYAIPTLCVKYTTNGICKQCDSRSAIIFGQCFRAQFVSLCERFASNKVDCEKCGQYARLVNKTCVYNELNCKEQGQNGCAVCQGENWLYQGHCYSKAGLEYYYQEPNCATWQGGYCIDCEFGWVFHQQVCLLPNQKTIPKPTNPATTVIASTPIPQGASKFDYPAIILTQSPLTQHFEQVQPPQPPTPVPLPPQLAAVANILPRDKVYSPATLELVGLAGMEKLYPLPMAERVQFAEMIDAIIRHNFEFTDEMKRILAIEQFKLFVRTVSDRKQQQPSQQPPQQQPSQPTP